MRGQPFEPGNRKGRGRPPGSRNKRSLFFEEFQKNGLDAIRQLKIMALKGDSRALAFWLERLVAPSKQANSPFRLPPIGSAENLVNVLPAVLQAVARGLISAQEGEAIGRMLESQQRVIEASEYDARIRALEQKTSNGSGGTPGNDDASRGGQQDSQSNPSQAVGGSSPLPNSSTAPTEAEPPSPAGSSATSGKDDQGEDS